MKICVLTSGHDVYDNRIYYKEILSLKERYDDIVLIAPGEKDFTTDEGIVVKCFRKRRSWHDRLEPMRNMLRLALETHAEVYHAHEPDSFQVAVKLKRKTGAKIIYDSHEYHPEAFAEHFSHGRWFFEKLIYLYERFYAVNADYIVTVNNLLVNKFKKYNKNVALIPNYPVFDNKSRVKEYQDKPVFVYAGGLRPDRGILKVLEAVKLSEVDCRFIFLGDFENEQFKKDTFKYIEDELKGRDVLFTGKVPHPEVFKYLSYADAGFVLLQPENLRYVNSEPIKLFEYMMSKTAVIASDFPMMKSIVEKSKCGLLVKPDDPRDIAEAIVYIAKNREEARAMGMNGYENTREEYNWNICRERLLNVYGSL